MARRHTDLPDRYSLGDSRGLGRMRFGWDGHLYVLRPPGSATWAPVTFYQPLTGGEYVHYGVRATPRAR